MAGKPTIYAAITWGGPGAEDSLAVWLKDQPRVEVRGKYWQGRDPGLYVNDRLHQVLDALPGWFVSGLFSDEVIPVTYWERYEPPYRILEALLNEDGI